LTYGQPVKSSEFATAVTPSQDRLRNWMLLVLLILIWAVSWPVIKVGVAEIPPIWYGCLRYLAASLILFAFVTLRGGLARPPRTDWPLVVVSGALQMAAYSALTSLALTILPPGRASVLAFSTPIFTVPLAAWRLHETPSPRAAAGVVIGLLGVLAIASPSIAAGGAREALAYAMLMGAAAAWAVSIVAVRGHRFTASPLSLAPWQMLIAATILLPVALVVEGGLPPINAKGFFTLAYVSPVATAFAYWAVVEAGRRFPASTISIALLATPAVGLTISALTFGETIDASLAIGSVFTAVGIRLAVRSPGSEKRRQ